jgi:small subunit ribosomal protein S1
VVDYGVFVRLREGVEALISTQDIVEAEGTKIKLGDTVKVEVSSVDTVDRRLFVTMRNVGVEKPQPERTQKKKSAQSGGGPEADDKPIAGTIGDLIKEKLGGKLDLK